VGQPAVVVPSQYGDGVRLHNGKEYSIDANLEVGAHVRVWFSPRWPYPVLTRPAAEPEVELVLSVFWMGLVWALVGGLVGWAARLTLAARRGSEGPQTACGRGWATYTLIAEGQLAPQRNQRWLASAGARRWLSRQRRSGTG
jgi:hypothetical protein